MFYINGDSPLIGEKTGYKSPTNFGFSGYISTIPQPEPKYKYRDHTEDIHTVEELVLYMKEEFNRIDERLDQIENNNKNNIKDIKADIDDARRQIMNKSSFVYVPRSR